MKVSVRLYYVSSYNNWLGDKLVLFDQKGLENALSTLKDWETSALPRIRIKTKTNVFNVELVKALEFENMLQVLKAITISALSSESCGAHYRTDSIPDSSVPVRYVIQRNEAAHGTLVSYGRSRHSIGEDSMNKQKTLAFQVRRYSPCSPRNSRLPK